MDLQANCTFRKTDLFPNQKKQSNILNILRFLAMAFVFLLHGRGWISGIDKANVSFQILTQFPAWAGVWIFLFISGYLANLGFSSTRHPIVGSNLKITFCNFLKYYWSRFIRLAPAYYLYCIFWIFLKNPSFVIKDTSILLQIVFFAFNGVGAPSGLGHLWYVSLAFQLYLIEPFAYLFVRLIKRQSWRLAVYFLCLLGFLVLRTILYQNGVDWYVWIYTFFGTNLDFLICGMLTYEIAKNAAPSTTFFKILSCAFFIMLIIYTNFCYFLNELTIYRLLLPTIYIICCTSLIVSFKPKEDGNPSTSIGDVMNSPVLLINWFAQYSYEFYILHIATFSFIDEITKDQPFFQNLNVYNRYFYFLGLSFILCFSLSIVLSKATKSFLRQERKK